MLKVLLKVGGASPNQRLLSAERAEKDGSTPLMIISCNLRRVPEKLPRYMECINILLNAGADLTLTEPTEDGEGRRTATDIARQLNAPQDIIKLLMPQKLK